MVDWVAMLEDIETLTLEQDGYLIRNRIRPLDGTTYGSVVNDTDSQTNYPIREVELTIPKNLPPTAEGLEASRALATCGMSGPGM